MGPALIVVVDEVLVTGLAFGLESVGQGVGPFLSLQDRQVRKLQLHSVGSESGDDIVHERRRGRLRFIGQDL